MRHDITDDMLRTLCGLTPEEKPDTGCICGHPQCDAPVTCPDCLTVRQYRLRSPIRGTNCSGHCISVFFLQQFLGAVGKSYASPKAIEFAADRFALVGMSLGSLN